VRSRSAIHRQPQRGLHCEQHGCLDGDEVVMVYHAAGHDVLSRIEDTHPVLAKSLVGFERVRVAVSSLAICLRF
jgi:hypothetical protein